MTTWTVPATVLRIVDGDTVRLLLDLGWRISLESNVRLIGINAPELSTPEGRAARDFLVRLLAIGDRVVFESTCLDKYGRPLGLLTIADGPDVGQLMLDAGHAVAVGGR